MQTNVHNRSPLSFYFHRNMKTQSLLYQIALLLLIVACRSQGYSLANCKPVKSSVMVKRVGCVARSVPLFQCQGVCPSSESLHDKKCECCRPVLKRPIKVQLKCLSPKVAWIIQEHEVQFHLQCSCSRCYNH